MNLYIKNSLKQYKLIYWHIYCIVIENTKDLKIYLDLYYRTFHIEIYVIITNQYR